MLQIDLQERDQRAAALSRPLRRPRRLHPHPRVHDCGVFQRRPFKCGSAQHHHTAFTSSTREASMGKPNVVLFSVAALAGFAATNASATPTAPPVAPMSGVEQVRLICNEWGRVLAAAGLLSPLRVLNFSSPFMRLMKGLLLDNSAR